MSPFLSLSICISIFLSRIVIYLLFFLSLSVSVSLYLELQYLRAGPWMHVSITNRPINYARLSVQIPMQ